MTRKILVPQQYVDAEREREAREKEAKLRDLWYYNHSRCPKCQSELNVTCIGTSIPDTANQGRCTYTTCGWRGPIAEAVPPTLSTIVGKFRQYAYHKKSCPATSMAPSNFQKKKRVCTCGYDAAYDELINATSRATLAPRIAPLP